MSREEIQEIASTIRGQILYADQFAFGAWGAKDFVAGYARVEGEGFRMPFLKFKVNGMKFKGFVMVLFDVASDTYIVRTFQLRKSGVVWVDRVTDVWCDMLMVVINGLIER